MEPPVRLPEALVDEIQLQLVRFEQKFELLQHEMKRGAR